MVQDTTSSIWNYPCYGLISKEFDNDKLAEIILSKGDVQNKKTNVKANMTDWRLDTEHKEVSNLANKGYRTCK